MKKPLFLWILWGADLPSDSSQGSFDLTKPYNYGVILEKDSRA